MSPTTRRQRRRWIFASVGDVHGQFSETIRLIQRWESAHADATISFVLQVGDLEPHRNEHDMESMAAPGDKRALGDYHKVVSGELVVPWPLWFIGGNHEPWELLDSQDGQGFALGPPNINFLGRAGVTHIGPLRVAALSGIHGTNTLDKPRPNASNFRTIKNKTFINFTQEELSKIVQQAKDLRDEDLRTLLSQLGLRERAVEQILETSGVRNVDHVWSVRDETLAAAGVKEGPRSKLVAFQKNRRRDPFERAPVSSATSPGTNDDDDEDFWRSKKGLVDVLITHDWPSGIADPAIDPTDGRTRPVGNTPCRQLLEDLEPTLMLCGHMHHAHSAVVGPSIVRCLAKVPSGGSVAFFEVVVDEEDHSSHEKDEAVPRIIGARCQIREIR